MNRLAEDAVDMTKSPVPSRDANARRTMLHARQVPLDKEEIPHIARRHESVVTKPRQQGWCVRREGRVLAEEPEERARRRRHRGQRSVRAAKTQTRQTLQTHPMPLPELRLQRLQRNERVKNPTTLPEPDRSWVHSKRSVDDACASNDPELRLATIEATRTNALQEDALQASPAIHHWRPTPESVTSTECFSQTELARGAFLSLQDGAEEPFQAMRSGCCPLDSARPGYAG